MLHISAHLQLFEVDESSGIISMAVDLVEIRENYLLLRPLDWNFLYWFSKLLIGKSNDLFELLKVAFCLHDVKVLFRHFA